MFTRDITTFHEFLIRFQFFSEIHSLLLCLTYHSTLFYFVKKCTKNKVSMFLWNFIIHCLKMKKKCLTLSKCINFKRKKISISHSNEFSTNIDYYFIWEVSYNIISGILFITMINQTFIKKNFLSQDHAMMVSAKAWFHINWLNHIFFIYVKQCSLIMIMWIKSCHASHYVEKCQKL